MDLEAMTSSSEIFHSVLYKMNSTPGEVVHYTLDNGEHPFDMNALIGKKISLDFAGEIFCISTGKKIKKSYGQGYSYEAFIKLPECDVCIVKPELCHYSQGTCRDPKWGEEHCLQNHIIYAANSSGLKIGITREKQVPTRWIDQGATSAIPLYRVKDRLTAGLAEVILKEEFADRTDWRKMLKGEAVDIDLAEIRNSIHENYEADMEKLGAEELSTPARYFNYPVLSYPEKVTSLDLDKTPHIEGVLQGIKGQYLILSVGVLNIRKFQGHKVEIKAL